MYRKALFLAAAAVASVFLLSGTARADRGHHRRAHRHLDHHHHHRHYARSHHLGHHHHAHRGYSIYRSYRPYVGVSPYAYRAYRSHLYSPYIGRSYGSRYGYGGGGISVYGRRGGFYLQF